MEVYLKFTNSKSISRYNRSKNMIIDPSTNAAAADDTPDTPISIDDPDSVPIERWATSVHDIIKQITAARNDDAYTIYSTADFRTIRIANFAKFNADHYICMRTAGPGMDVQVYSHSLPELFDMPSSSSQQQQQQQQQTDGANIGVVVPSSSIFSPIGTIESHVNTFQLYLEQMDAFYDCMNTIDSLCCVVEPAVITTKSRSRTFRIESNVFVRIVVDPLAPASLVCTIIGPTYGTGRFRDLYDRYVRDWDPEADVHQNLLRIFQLEHFPARPTDDRQQTAAADANCGICLEYRCGRQTAFVSCDNRRCVVVYHPVCLRNWFRTLPDSRTFLEVTFGSCPYCKDKLSTSFVCLLTDDA